MSPLPENSAPQVARYEEVALKLLERIFAGTYSQGNKISPERELASLMFRFAKEKDSAHIIWYLHSENTLEALKNLK